MITEKVTWAEAKESGLGYAARQVARDPNGLPSVLSLAGIVLEGWLAVYHSEKKEGASSSLPSS